MKRLFTTFAVLGLLVGMAAATIPAHAAMTFVSADNNGDNGAH